MRINLKFPLKKKGRKTTGCKSGCNITMASSHKPLSTPNSFDALLSSSLPAASLEVGMM